MSDHVTKTIELLEEKLRDQFAEVARLKRMINELALLAGLDERYADVGADSARRAAALRSDQFYGRPLATVVREYLEMRQASNLGPATVNEIFGALSDGGFKFDAASKENAKRGLRISLAKNTQMFHKLPNGEWGLLAWYPNAKSKAPRSATKDAPDSEGSGGEEESNENEAVAAD